MDRLTVQPFLLSMFIGVFGMPTDVVTACFGCMGIEHTQPWRSTSDGVVSRTGRVLMSRLRALCSGFRGHPFAMPAAAMAALVVLSQVLPADTNAMLAIGAVMASADQLKALRDQAKDVREKVLALSQLVAEGKELTEEQTKELAALQKKGATVAAALAIAEEANEAERKMTPAGKDPDVEAAARAAAAGGVQLGKNNADDDPKRGFKDHRDFLTSVMNAGRGKKMDARLVPLRATQGSDEAGTYSDPAGGFLVPHGVAPGILSIAPENDPLDGLITSIPMTAPTVSFNARVDKDHSSSVSGGFQVTRRPETVDGTASRMAFEQVTLTANEEFGLAFASERIINDSPQSFVAIVQAGMRSEYVANAMNERINGSGAGERQGVLTAGCRIAVAKEAGQAAASILKENIDKMAARCWRFNQAVWLANHNTRPQLKSLVQFVGTGGNSVAYFTTEGGTEKLDGRPIFFTEFAKTLGTEGDLMLLVPSEYLEGTYQSEQYAESIHVRFAAAERGFRFYRRNDGQWWWRSALTPKNGSTLSPVVTLATRS